MKKFSFIAILLCLSLQNHGSMILKTPRYVISRIAWQLENVTIEISPQDKSPLLLEPLFSYTFFSKELNRTTSINTELKHLEDEFEKFKALFDISNDEWNRLIKFRNSRRSKNMIRIKALQQPRTFFIHNPLIATERIESLEKIFSLLGLNLYACDITLGIGRIPSFLKILPTKSSFIGPTIYFETKPFTKPVLLMDVNFRNLSIHQNEFRFFIPRLIEELMKVLAAYNVDDYYIEQVENKYLPTKLNDQKYTLSYKIKRNILNTRTILNEGIRSYIEKFYDKS